MFCQKFNFVELLSNRTIVKNEEIIFEYFMDVSYMYTYKWSSPFFLILAHP